MIARVPARHSDPEFSVKSRSHAGVMVLGLAGSLTARNPRTLHRSLVAALTASQPPLIIVDLESLHDLDAGGLAILLGATDHARACGGQLLVTGTAAGLPARTELERRSTLTDALAELAAAA
ncbi:STAS domain-containing protein [Nonomuraea sp. NPDC059007]|uniref:STAS domain-containing protein n=1 Tax=Nonomuraea sp. NPDC059007 TaxID=3346692 RepID=UPI0036C93EF9